MTDDSLEVVTIVFCYISESFELLSVTRGALISDNPTSALIVENQSAQQRVALTWISSGTNITAPSGGHFATLNFRQASSHFFDCHFIIDTCTIHPIGGTEFKAESGSPYKPICDYPLEIFCVDVDETFSAQTSAAGISTLNFPNPFNSSTTIEVDIPASEYLTITIYDILGRRVRTIVDGLVTRGLHQFAWDGNDESGKSASSGVYLARMTSRSDCTVRKLVLLR